MNSDQIMRNLAERMAAGEINAAQANVEKVRLSRFQIVSGRMSSDVRSALNDAVKNGQLGRLPKKGLLKEVYFHPDCHDEAVAARVDVAVKAAEAIAKVAIA